MKSPPTGSRPAAFPLLYPDIALGPAPGAAHRFATRRSASRNRDVNARKNPIVISITSSSFHPACRRARVSGQADRSASRASGDVVGPDALRRHLDGISTRGTAGMRRVRTGTKTAPSHLNATGKGMYTALTTGALSPYSCPRCDSSNTIRTHHTDHREAWYCFTCGASFDVATADRGRVERSPGRCSISSKRWAANKRK